MQNPMQPIGLDEHGTARFKKNAIVRLLLDTHPNLEQFYQLIGYSVSGFGELSNNSEESIAIADGIVDILLKQPDPPKRNHSY